MEDEEALSFILKTAVTTVRVCRATLEAILGSLERCVEWRSLQTLPGSEKEVIEKGQTGTGTNSVPDWGDVSFLQEVVEWAKKVAEVIGLYGTVLKNKIILPRTLDVRIALKTLVIVLFMSLHVRYPLT